MNSLKEVDWYPMPLVPQNWNVVVVGHWNRAILTPAGVSKRLFKLPDGTPIDVLVPLDAMLPYQIKHNNIIVAPGSDKLVVTPVKSTIEQLVDALQIALNALEDLPRTPFYAAGFNLRYSSDEPIELLQRITTHDWDDRISEMGYQIAERSISRSLRWQGGKINVEVTQQERPAFTIQLNFDLKSDDVERLKEWIRTPPDQIQAEANRILLNTIGIAAEDFQYE